jgi:hypothetical protein
VYSLTILADWSLGQEYFSILLGEVDWLEATKVTNWNAQIKEVSRDLGEQFTNQNFKGP